jgi:hypothetical protein
MLLPVAAVKFIDGIQTQPNLQVVPVATITYRVFHHDLLMAKLHHIDYKNDTDGIHGSKAMLHGFQKI